MKSVLTIILFSISIITRSEHLIQVTSNDWMIYDRVLFNYVVDKSDSLERKETPLHKQVAKDVIKIAGTRWKFRCNTGSVRLLEGWVFNRDSAWKYHNGRLIMIAEKTVNREHFYDTVTLQLPHAKDMQMRLAPQVDFFRGIFEVFFIDIPGRESFKLDPSDLGNRRFFLNNYKLQSNARLLEKAFGGSKAKDYYLDEREYVKNISISFINPESGEDVIKVGVPPSIYIRNLYFSFPAKEGEYGRSGRNGKMFSFKTEQELRDSNLLSDSAGRVLALNGGDGSNGMQGLPGKDVSIVIERFSASDSIARITIRTADTTITRFLDIFNGGQLQVHCTGGKGGDGGHAGGCGFIQINGRTSAYGLPGLPGKGGDGGSGGNVSMLIDRFYEPQIYRIKIINDGGKPGFGGFNYFNQNCAHGNPYAGGPDDPLGNLLFGKQSSSVKAKVYGAKDLGEPGKKGAAGNISINFKK